MVKIIIFDADGVLINADYVSVVLDRDYGIKKAVTSEFFDGVFLECVVGKKDLKEEIGPFLKEWGWKGSVDEFLHFWHRAEHIINEDLIEYIQKLRKKGIICCLATNQTKYRFAYMLEEMGFQHAFDRVYASGLIGHRKPYPQFYQHIIDDLNVNNKKEVLLWDDAEENIEGAKRFGIRAELYTTFADFKETMMHNYHFNSSAFEI